MHLKAKQYWLVPELVDDERVVFDVLGFSAADAQKEANVLILTRPGVPNRVGAGVCFVPGDLRSLVYKRGR